MFSLLGFWVLVIYIMFSLSYSQLFLAFFFVFFYIGFYSFLFRLLQSSAEIFLFFWRKLWGVHSSDITRLSCFALFFNPGVQCFCFQKWTIHFWILSSKKIFPDNENPEFSGWPNRYFGYKSTSATILGKVLFPCNKHGRPNRFTYVLTTCHSIVNRLASSVFIFEDGPPVLLM